MATCSLIGSQNRDTAHKQRNMAEIHQRVVDSHRQSGNSHQELNGTRPPPHICMSKNMSGMDVADGGMRISACFVYVAGCVLYIRVRMLDAECGVGHVRRYTKVG